MTEKSPKELASPIRIIVRTTNNETPIKEQLSDDLRDKARKFAVMSTVVLAAINELRNTPEQTDDNPAPIINRANQYSITPEEIAKIQSSNPTFVSNDD